MDYEKYNNVESDTYTDIEDSPKNQNYDIYKLMNDYKIPKSAFNDLKFTGSLKEIKELLNNNEGYHIRINPENKCILYGDIDHINDKYLIKKILFTLSDFFNVDITKISYTVSKKPNSEYSYHWTIPSLYSTPTEIKNIFNENFKNKGEFTDFKTYIDLSIYNTHWFRLPNQTNNDKPLKHKIKNGCMVDFIVDYIDNATKYIYNASNKEIGDKIKKCLECINIDRCSSYEEWSKVGFIINNEMGEEGFKIFNEWSALSDKYNFSEVHEWFNKLKTRDPTDNKMTLGTLKRMAKEDNIILYNKYFMVYDNSVIDTDCKIDFNQPISTGLLSAYFKEKYNKFIYSNGSLYFFNGVYWKKDDVNYSILHNFIDSTFYQHLRDMFYEFDKSETNKNISQDERDSLLKRLQGVRKELDNIRKYKPRESLVRDILCKITNNDIKFDENPYLFSFNNKVYDLRQSKFIQPLAEQYISKTTGYNYDDNDNEIENKIKELKTLLKTILPDDEIRDYYMTLLSTGLDGIPLEKFIIANGGGRNGKGLLHELIQYTLGDYAYVLPSSVLTDKSKSSGSSNPDIALLDRVRWSVSREPEKDKKINGGVMKELTGGTEIKARLNYSNDNKVNLSLSFFLECNEKPFLDSVDDATAERIIDVLFPNKFIEKYKYDALTEDERKNTFIRNDRYKTIEFKENNKQAMFIILSEYYKEFTINDREIKTPAAILERNIKYLESSDELLDWVHTNYQKTDNIKDTVKLKIIYNNFKNSEYFENLSKAQKRANNYKNFTLKLKSNYFLKRFIKENKDNCTILQSYKTLIDETEDNELDI